MPKTIHEPVLLEESIELLKLKPGMIVVDATLGGGGHSIEILKRIMPGGNLIAIDQDEEAVKKFQIKLKGLKLNLKKENVVLANDNFARLKNILERLKIKKVGTVIADLGISSDQLESAERGFSFMKDGPLDMRMDPKNKLTAFEVVNNYPEEELVRILREYGEERYARRIARKIVEIRGIKGKMGVRSEKRGNREEREIKKGRRGTKKEGRKIGEIRTTGELVEIIEQAVPEKYKHGRIHFATKTFQALRIEVNDELDSLKSFLSQAVEVLAPGGRIAVISFHSGEDRIVKIFFRENARGCVCPPNFPKCVCGYEQGVHPVKYRGAVATKSLFHRVKIITKKPIVPSEKETKDNPRARSAKLRIAEKANPKQSYF